MEVEIAAAIILVLGLVLLVIEGFAPGGYLLIPGGVLVVLGVYGFAAPGNLYTWWSPVTAIVACIPITAATLVLYKRLGSPEPPSTTVADSLVGKEGEVTVEVTSGNIRGKVRIGPDVWSADADGTLPVGTKVVVDRSEGVHVHVVRKE